MSDKELDMDEQRVIAYSLGLLYGMTDSDEEESLVMDAFFKLRDLCEATEDTFAKQMHIGQVLGTHFHDGIKAGTEIGQEKRDQWNLYRKNRIARAVVRTAEARTHTPVDSGWPADDPEAGHQL